MKLLVAKQSQQKFIFAEYALKENAWMAVGFVFPPLRRKRCPQTLGVSTPWYLGSTPSPPEAQPAAPGKGQKLGKLRQALVAGWLVLGFVDLGLQSHNTDHRVILSVYNPTYTQTDE